MAFIGSAGLHIFTELQVGLLSFSLDGSQREELPFSLRNSKLSDKLIRLILKLP
jgi:hypothetical protein